MCLTVHWLTTYTFYLNVHRTPSWPPQHSPGVPCSESHSLSFLLDPCSPASAQVCAPSCWWRRRGCPPAAGRGLRPSSPTWCCEGLRRAPSWAACAWSPGAPRSAASWWPRSRPRCCPPGSPSRWSCWAGTAAGGSCTARPPSPAWWSRSSWSSVARGGSLAPGGKAPLSLRIASFSAAGPRPQDVGQLQLHPHLQPLQGPPGAQPVRLGAPVAGGPTVRGPALRGGGDCGCDGSRSRTSAPDPCLPPAPSAGPGPTGPARCPCPLVRPCPHHGQLHPSSLPSGDLGQGWGRAGR